MITGSPVSRRVGAFGYQQAMLAGSVAPRPFSPFGDVDLASRSYEIHALDPQRSMLWRKGHY